MAELITTEYKNGVASVFLNRPERKNALSMALLKALSKALNDAQRPETGALILSGAGGCFSAGADIGELSGNIEDIRVDDAIGAVTRQIIEFPVPVIAAIDGPCMGGAVDLALSCDVRIAAHNAFFQVPATRIGLLYNPPAILRMQRRLGRDTLFRLLTIGERFDAEAALRTGIVSHLVEQSEAYPTAHELARQAAANLRSAVSSTKALLNAIENDNYDEQDWQRRRREHLSSSERHAAVARAKVAREKK
jgi:enoyl-CoA hydratase